MPREQVSIMQLKGKVAKNCKLYGLLLSGDALHYLAEMVYELGESDRDTVLEKIWSELAKRKYGTGAISLEQCESVCKEFTVDSEQSLENFNVYAAFDIPKYVYDTVRSCFTTVGAKMMSDNSEEKTNFYKNRYLNILQRVQRNPLFAVRSTATTLKNRQKYQLKSVESLYGSNITMENITLFGMLTQLKLGEWYLEDVSGAIRLDIAKTEFQPGLIYEGCFVLCEGAYNDQILQVTGMSLPPPEPAKISREQLGDINMFGGDNSTCAAGNASLQQRLNAQQDAFIVFLSHIHLDDLQTIEKLSMLFSGYNDFPPVAFVLCGPFLSTIESNLINRMVQGLSRLADLIKANPGLKVSKFVFVPAESDDGFLGVNPRPPIRDFLTSQFTHLIKNSVFTTNPCRLQLCTREIVVYREDLISRSFRSRITGADPESSLTKQFAESLASQSSLTVLPLHRLPVLWSYDHAFSLYPLPDVCMIADSLQPFTESVSGCHFVSPGMFPQSNFPFKVYYPLSNEMEDCEITSDMQANLTT